MSSQPFVEVHRKKACRIELNVKAPSEMVNQARKNAIKAVGKEVSLPGFRKGHAPQEMLLKQFPKDIERALHKELADLAFVSAQKEVNLPLLNQNGSVSFDLKKISEEGAELIFSFETEPKIPKVDPISFVKKEIARAAVEEKQIEEAIRQMRYFYAEWKLIQDRPIQEGDAIMIDLDTIDGEKIENVFHHIRFEVAKERMANWMKKLVAGAKIGDVLEGVSEADEDATEGEKGEFKSKRVRITILKVEQAILPELDDAFAKKVGASDIAHMRQSITELLNRQADEKVKEGLREQVNDYLLQNYEFELPQSLIDTETKHRLQQSIQEPNAKAKWDRMSQEERKQLLQKMEVEATQAVRLFYLSRSIVQNEKIPITHQEVQQEAIHTARAHGMNQKEELPKELFALALSKVILAKAQDFVLADKKA